jgi:uracil-DNA glycosylase
MATELIPERATLDALRAAAAGCRACPLWKGTTQTVFGEGLKRSRVMLVGEQPGDREDRQGHPFVGPAGRELDKALEAAGIDRADAYVTDDEARRAERERFTEDLRVVAQVLEE